MDAAEKQDSSATSSMENNVVKETSPTATTSTNNKIVVPRHTLLTTLATDKPQSAPSAPTPAGNMISHRGTDPQAQPMSKQISLPQAQQGMSKQISQPSRKTLFVPG